MAKVPKDRTLRDWPTELDFLELIKDGDHKSFLVRIQALKEIFGEGGSGGSCAIDPTVTRQPSVNLTSTPASGNFERGTVILSQNLTANYDAGEITDGDGSTTHPLKGAVDTYDFSGVGIVGEITQASNVYVIPTFEVILGTNTWSVDANYLQGTEPYFDSCGDVSNVLDGFRNAGTVSDSVSPIRGYWSVWWDVGSPIPVDSAGVRLMNFVLNTSDVFILNTGNVQNQFFFAIPDVYTVDEVIDLDALNQNITSQYVYDSTVSVADASGVNFFDYDIYRMNTAIPYTDNHRHQIFIA